MNEQELLDCLPPHPKPGGAFSSSNPLPGGMTAREIAQETGYSISTVRKTLRTLHKEGKVTYYKASRPEIVFDGLPAGTRLWFRPETS